ncbi:16S rRNA methyltransferase [Dictyobacter alpinus]|uniref:16S rRNA (guanine(1405)-N(7))-methyltransferase n=1 Tax=Dictyobacter alpinus TaxID=2014873 RepID=A0A402B367_9CHLR|nr:16S rRNA methyltransferase [Dictyobacter alpinus]GCE25800.1 16S rRNA methyltransferase [Dictyobacter alpinus]
MLKIDKTLALQQLNETVLTSSKYKDICPELVSAIGAQELLKRRTLKEAVKATKNKLHQIGGAYLDGHEDYPNWLATIAEARLSGSPETLKQSCRHIMAYHASTRERLPILEDFYHTIFTHLPPIQSIIDIACGLNPLALPWMISGGSLPSSYCAYDIYQHIMDFLAAYFQRMSITGKAQVCDVIQSCPTQHVDLALVLKVLPCLEQVDKRAAYQLLHTLNARHIIVSYPIQSLGGKDKGMATYYTDHFQNLVKDDQWSIQRIEFATELVFIIDTHAVKISG